jgi:hypothetical protein
MPDGDVLDSAAYSTDSQTMPSNYDTPGDQALVLTAGSSGQLVVEPSQAATYGSSQDWNVQATPYAVNVPATQVSTFPPTVVTYGCLSGWTPTEGDMEPTSGVDTAFSLVTGAGPYDLVDPLLSGDSAASSGYKLVYIGSLETTPTPHLTTSALVAPFSYICQNMSYASPPR